MCQIQNIGDVEKTKWNRLYDEYIIYNSHFRVNFETYIAEIGINETHTFR